MVLTKTDFSQIKSLTKQEIRLETIPMKKNIAKLRVEVSELSSDVKKLRMEVLGFGKRLDDVEERVRMLPTRDEFFTAMDRIMTELKTVRQEQSFMSSRIAALEGI